MDNQRDKIFNANQGNFQDLALEIFQFQYQHNSIYRTYVDMLKFNPQKIKSFLIFPFCPSGFLKPIALKQRILNLLMNFKAAEQLKRPTATTL